MTTTIMHCAVCGADEASTYLGEPGPGIVRCFAVGCGAQVGGYATDEEAIAEWNRRAAAMDAAMTEAYCPNNDDLTDCFRHHITTTIGWLAFGARPGPEMQMYEEGFKAGYRRCQSDHEPDLGEDDDLHATPACWVRINSDGKATYWETEVPDSHPLYRRAPSPQQKPDGTS